MIIHVDESSSIFVHESARWHATLDGYEPGERVGYGPTPQEAVEDLFVQLEERHYHD